MSDERVTRCEEALCAMASGNLDPTGWAHSRILALGLSGQRNPLGSAVLHWMEHESANEMLVRFHLAGEIERRNVAKARDSIDVANDAMKWWQHRHCPTCSGRGVLNFEQAICRACGGTGDQRRPSHKPVVDAVALIEEALSWLEGQMVKRLAGSVGKPAEPSYSVRLHTENIEDVPLTGMRTAAKPACP